jgi:hypothetical protein
MNCPHCKSDKIDKKNYGKKAGAVIGGAALAVGGWFGFEAGAEAGAVAGAVAGPLGVVVGGVVGALVGAAAGIFIGAKAGEAVDEHILDNYHCLECGYKFSQ